MWYHRVRGGVTHDFDIAVNAWYDMDFGDRYVYNTFLRRLSGVPAKTTTRTDARASLVDVVKTLVKTLGRWRVTRRMTQATRARVSRVVNAASRGIFDER